MNEPFFEIKGISFSQEELCEEVEKAILEKEQKGVYDQFDITELVDFDVLSIKHESQFLEYYLKAIKRSWAIDINDFEIPAKPGISGYGERIFKKIIWHCLKFYTYRLFSQQREFNSQATHTLIALHEDYNRQIEELKSRLDQLKKES